MVISGTYDARGRLQPDDVRLVMQGETLDWAVVVVGATAGLAVRHATAVG
jgi:hypothetical protein